MITRHSTSAAWRTVLATVLMCASTLLGAALAPAGAQAAPAFKVLGFYNGTFDPAHISFVREANPWFTRLADANGFSYTATNNWGNLNAGTLSQYQVVMFLDDLPTNASQRSAFQAWMQNGGAFFGFHVSAFNTNPNGWSWYHHTLLGTGAFQTNSWGPTAETLKVENQAHPAMAGLGAQFASSVSEWYSWRNDLRTNPNIDILASIAPSSFPVGTEPGQTWQSGYFPILWSNRNYKMLYANFGHNAMDYGRDIPLSSTFASGAQNQFLLNGLKWLGGGATQPPPGPISPTAWYTVVNKGNSKCVDARGAGSANGTVVQQYACNSSFAQQYQFQPTSAGYSRINNRNNSAQVIDVAGVSNADNAPLHLWAYGGGNNQQWQAVEEGGGYFHFISRHSAKCLSVPGGSITDGVQLVQLPCNGGAAQSFRVVPQPSARS